MPSGSATALRVPAGRASIIAATLRKDPEVLRVSIDHRRYRDANPTSEPYWDELWGLENTGQDLFLGTPGTGGAPDVDIDGRQALGITTGTASTVVAVIDDGVDFSHPDLEARAWTNPGESGAGRETNGVDDDANGYIDDVHGWDFCHDDNTVHDFGDDFHGTHVAGTIAASLDGTGVVGVAPGVSIMALKFLGNDASCGFDSGAIAAIAYAKSFGVRIANASWGGDGRPEDAPELYEAIATSGMLFVAAAGNSGNDNDDGPITSLPASFDLPNILSVAAVDNSGALASFSNYGATSVDLAAPGQTILSALPADEVYPDPGWGWLDGTSMAAPHVSGTAALVVSALPALAADPVALRSRLINTGKPAPGTTGLTASGRLVNPYRALDMVGAVAAAPTTFGFVVGTAMTPTGIPTQVGWPPATDDRSGNGAYALEKRSGSGPWVTAVAATSSGHATPTLTFGTSHGLRVRARDRAGNWGPWSGASTITPARYEESSVYVTYRGSWKVLNTSAASGGQQRYASAKGASVTFHFTGRAFALIAPKGPTRGSAKLYVDGKYISTVSLYRSSWVPMLVVASRSWSSSAAHSVKWVVSGTSGHARFDVDAFAVLR